MSHITGYSAAMRILLLWMLALPFSISANSGHDPDNMAARQAKKRLDEIVKLAPRYAERYEHRLDSLKRLANDASRSDSAMSWQLNMRLAAAYRSFNTDSALHYSQQAEHLAHALGNRRMEHLGAIARIASLSTAGLFADARSALDSLQPAAMEPDVRIAYWKSARLLYGYQEVYVDGHDYYAHQYRQRYLACDDSLLKYLPSADTFRRFIACERLVAEGQYDTARRGLESLLPELNESDNLYGMVCYQLAEVARHKHDEPGYMTWLSRAAASDVEANVREGLALPMLALALYKEGDLNSAFSYINFALEDATRGNARMRAVAIAKQMPVIDEAYRQKISASRDQLMVYLLMVFILFAVSAVLLAVLRRQIIAARESRRRLAATAHLQDTYMGHFIALYSNYADRLDSLTRMVSRKIAAGETAELQKMIKAGKFSDDGAESFEQTFDKAFLDIYPGFVDQVNSLLVPEQRISLRHPGQLTTELRIYAFVRLGVEESQRIAQVLHCSVTTVYAYRNRMRNRAINRATFDDDIKSLGSHDEN